MGSQDSGHAGDERGLLATDTSCEVTPEPSTSGIWHPSHQPPPAGRQPRRGSHASGFANFNKKTQKGFEKAGRTMLRGMKEMVGLHHLDDATQRRRPDGFEELRSPQMMTRDEGGRRQHLKVTIHEGARLLAKSVNGYSDPYVTISLAGQHANTRIVMQSCNPKWEQALYLELPKLLDSKTDVMRVTLLDYDGPLVQSQFLGRFHVNVVELWRNYREGEEPVTRQWYKLLGKKTSRRTERGELCMSLSFVDEDEIKQATDMQRNAVAKCHSMQDEDLDLADWKLRVVVTEGRGFDAKSLSANKARADSSPFKYRISLRLGSCTYMTDYVTPEVHYLEDPEGAQPHAAVADKSSPSWLKLGSGAAVPAGSAGARSSEESSGAGSVHEGPEDRKGYLRYVWNETFDIPLKEATKALKMDAKLSNRLMTMGNLMGLDGLFWDTRENLSETEELRFIVQKTFREGLEDEDDMSERAYITGVGQYPLSGIYAFIDQATGRTSAVEPCCSPEPGQAQEKTGAQSPPEEPEDGLADLVTPIPQVGRHRSIFTQALKTIISVAPMHEEAPAALERRPTEDELAPAPGQEEEEQESMGISQHAWITLDGRGGSSAGELLVSFTFIKDPQASRAEGDGSCVDFDAWLAGEAEQGGEAVDGAAGGELPPALKDGLVVDEELAMPLQQLFHLLASPTSAFNNAKEKLLQMREVDCGEWLPEDGCVRRLKKTFIVKLPPNKLGPTEAYSEVQVDVLALAHSGFSLRSTIRNPKITFGDTFVLTSQVAAVPCSATSCKLQVSYSVDFVKSCIFKSTILKASLDGAKNTSQVELGILKKIASGAAADDSSTLATGDSPVGAFVSASTSVAQLSGVLRQLFVLGALMVLLLGAVVLMLGTSLRANRTVQESLSAELEILRQLLISLQNQAAIPADAECPDVIPTET